MELPSRFPSRQIREKRLEITIGITQQAAMAIQNDRLQKEVVERERLEREFQLARDIQQTFLPDTLPEHQGWELNCLWRPARQVSGDFYDVIELPNQQWGIVIADVADKGMPAALYMTLIRSLIRAAVKDEFAPASVLRRVNDLLVEDSKSGMFVTIVYAVLSLEEGILTYANAGHNPPLLLRASDFSLERMPGTAMALGIFEGIPVRHEQVQIEPGDYIVFYTDGITEAFSPDDVMFAESGLIEVVKQSKATSAERLSELIDQAVNEFTEGDTSNDDITLVVLKRKNTA
jgi:phosphoserine phosphatase RsbU/P